MPTYEYACTACQHEFEAEQSIKDPALTKCPKCGEDKAKRQISRGTGFILKGGGWYSDLYASPTNKPSGDAKTSEAKSGDTSTAPAASSDGAASAAPATAPSTSSSTGGASSGGSSSGGSSSSAT